MLQSNWNEVEPLKKLDLAIGAAGWDSGKLASNSREFAFAYQHRDRIASLIGRSHRLTELERSIKQTELVSEIYRGQLRSRQEKETELIRREARNAEIERNRASAKGFWGQLALNVLTW